MGTVAWGHIFVVEYMPSIYETLDSILSTQERKEKAGVGDCGFKKKIKTQT